MRKNIYLNADVSIARHRSVVISACLYLSFRSHPTGPLPPPCPSRESVRMQIEFLIIIITNFSPSQDERNRAHNRFRVRRRGENSTLRLATATTSATARRDAANPSPGRRRPPKHMRIGRRGRGRPAHPGHAPPLVRPAGCTTQKNRGGIAPSPIGLPLPPAQFPVRMGNGSAFVQADEPLMLLFARIL